MYKEIPFETADGGSKNFPLLASATTSLRYKMLFGAELLGEITAIVAALGSEALQKIFGASQEAAAAGQEEVDLASLDPDTLRAFTTIAASGKLDTLSKMAYVMNQQAEGADMKKLSIEGYLDWLDQFETMTFLSHSIDILDTYMANRQGTSKLKKDPAPSIEK